MNISYQILKEERKVIATMVADGKEFVGVAKCDSKDNFNELIGMEIAKQKACIKYADYKQVNMVKDLKALDITMEELGKLRNSILKDIANKQKEIENRKRLVKSYQSQTEEN